MGGGGGGDFLGLGIRVKRDQGIQNFGECLKISIFIVFTMKIKI